MRIGVGLPMEDVDGVAYPYRDIRAMAVQRRGRRVRLVVDLRPPAVPRGRRDHRPARVLDDPDGDRRGHVPGPARRARALHRVPQPGAPRQDGRDPRPRERRPADPGDRVRLARPRVRGVRLPDRPQGRAVRGLGHDHPRACCAKDAPTMSAASTRSGTPSWSRGRVRDLPILIAAKRPRMLDLTASYADAWNLAWFGLPDQKLDDARADLEAACARIGRDPATIEITVGVEVRFPGLATSPPEGSGLSATPLNGEPDEIAAAFRDLRGVGGGPPRHRARPGDAQRRSRSSSRACTAIEVRGRGSPSRSDRSGRGARGRTCRPVAWPTAGRPPTATCSGAAGTACRAARA